MKNNKNVNESKEKDLIAEDKHKLSPSVTGRPSEEMSGEKELGKLPNDEFGVDHNSDPILAKNQ